MAGKDTDSDFILIDDLIADASEDGTAQDPPPRPPVQMPLPQAASPQKPTTGGQQPDARPPIPPPQGEKTEAPPRPTPHPPSPGVGQESKTAAVMGVLLILMAVGMYIYYSPPSQETPPSAPAPRKFSVPPAAAPMTAPAPEHQPPLQSPAAPATGEVAADAGPPPKETPAAPPDEGAIDPSVKDFLSAWREAWEKSAGPTGALGPYLACYAPEFHHNGMNKDAWAADKAVKNRRKDWIRVRISDILVSAPLDNDTLRVTFSQEYTSSNYRDASLKTLILKKTGNSWQIIAVE